MHPFPFLYFNSFIYSRVIYRRHSPELCKIWIRKSLRGCALTYNVVTRNRLFFGLGTQGHARGLCLGQALLISWLFIKACQKAAPHCQSQKGKAEKTSSQELSPSQHTYLHLLLEWFTRRERLVLGRRLSSCCPFPGRWCPCSRRRGMCLQFSLFAPWMQQCHRWKVSWKKPISSTISRCHTDLVHHL